MGRSGKCRAYFGELRAALKESMQEETARKGKLFRSGREAIRWLESVIVLPRFKRDYRIARKHPEFDEETLEYVFNVMIFWRGAAGRAPGASPRQTQRQLGRIHGVSFRRRPAPDLIESAESRLPFIESGLTRVCLPP